MNERQKQILEIIKNYTKENGYSPTIREICSLANLKSTSTVHSHIKRLEAEGYITKGFDMPRSIVVKDTPSELKFVVNTIAFKRSKNKEYILIEENKNPKSNKKQLKLPGGDTTKNVFNYLKEEFKNNGLEIKNIFGESKVSNVSENDEATILRPFHAAHCLTKKEAYFVNTFICEIDSNSKKNLDPKGKLKWVAADKLEELLKSNEENFTAYNLEALNMFFDYNNPFSQAIY